MVKTCPKCNTKNENSADFCVNCGELFPEHATGEVGTGKRMISRVVIAFLVIIVMGLTPFLFGTLGMFDETTLSETFSAGGLTFNYPSDWEIVESPGDIVSGGSGLYDLGTLAGSEIGLTISAADLSEGWMVEEAKNVTKKSIQNVSAVQILSDTSRTVNGVTVYEMIGTVKNTTTKQESKFLYVVTGKDRQVVYYMQFIGDVSAFDSNKAAIDDIINTIEIE